MEHANWLWLVPGLPLLGSVVCGVLHFMTLRARRLAGPDGAATAGPVGPGALAPFVACAALAGSLALTLRAALAIAGHDEHGATALTTAAWEWIRVPGLAVDVALIADRLSMTLGLVITGVGLLIHVYSAGYMKGDPGYAKFFAFLNLFVTAMLMLVLSSSLLGMFVGWEGVGLCSYLLIGFWYEKGWPADAAQKAFVTNRVGDAFFLLGSFLLVRLFGTLDLASLSDGVLAAVASGEHGTELAVAALLLFGGCCGKSAQVPLFTWLPDAMAGPTPVSALIHAATMVTSGIYLIARLNPLFAACPAVLYAIACIGALTALIGASTALVQRDIKKVLAYSTVSQLGYMFLGLGSGAFGAAVFHLVTHAFFKGLLFLAAGSVIHGMHEEQDMHRMGGLRKYMPRTFMTFVVGAAALSGLPLLSGFFSKDEILAMAVANGFHGQPWYLLPWIIGVVAAAMTAFYSWRMVALTFFGEERFDAHAVHPHESPASMTVPLMVLAGLALTGGFLNLPPVLPFAQTLHHWLEPVTAAGDALVAGRLGEHGLHLPAWLEWMLLALGAGIALLFAHRGFHAYTRGAQSDADFERARPGVARFLQGAWGVDRAYTENVVQPTKLFAFMTSVVVDQFAIDGAVNGLATLARKLGGLLRRTADGHLSTYALWIGAGAVLMSFLWMWA